MDSRARSGVRVARRGLSLRVSPRWSRVGLLAWGRNTGSGGSSRDSVVGWPQPASRPRSSRAWVRSRNRSMVVLAACHARRGCRRRRGRCRRSRRRRHARSPAPWRARPSERQQRLWNAVTLLPVALVKATAAIHLIRDSLGRHPRVPRVRRMEAISSCSAIRCAATVTIPSLASGICKRPTHHGRSIGCRCHGRIQRPTRTAMSRRSADSRVRREVHGIPSRFMGGSSKPRTLRSSSPSRSASGNGWTPTSKWVRIHVVKHCSDPLPSLRGPAIWSSSGPRSTAAKVRRNVDPRTEPRIWLPPMRLRSVAARRVPDGHAVAPAWPA